mgnify:CR=1 FL=1
MIKLNHLQKNYASFKLDCTLEVKKGYVTGLIGRNGSGKTTTFKALLGLFKPDGGQATFLGKDAFSMTPQDRQNIGVVLSNSSFSKEFTVEEIASVLAQLYIRFDKDLYFSLIDQYSLPRKKKTKEFSTGMMAKLKLIIAMTHEAKALILDEPTASLDVIARDELLDMLRDYMDQDEERAILISSHISTDLEQLCDDLYVINDGQVIFHEDTDTLLSDYATLKVSVEDYTNLDKTHLLCSEETSYGYTCLTNQKQYYLENYPAIVIENSSIDTVYSAIIKEASL